MRKFKPKRMMLILPAILVAATVVACLLYNVLARVAAENKAFSVLENSTAEQIRTINAALDGRFATLEAYSHSLAAQSGFSVDSQDTRERLAAMRDGRYFSDMFIVDERGMAYDTEGNVADVSDRDYFIRSSSGRRAIQYIESGRLAEQALFGLAVPLKQNGMVIGSVVGALNETVLRNAFITEAYGGEGFSFICDSSGEVMINGENGELSNVSNVFTMQGADDTAAAERVASDISGGIPGRTRVVFKGAGHYIAYSPTGVNDWMLVTVVPASQISDEVAANVAPSIITTIVVTVVSIGLLLLMYLNQHRNERQLVRERRDFRTAALQNGRMLRIFDIKRDRFINAYGDNTISWRDTPEEMVADGLVAADSVNEYLQLYNAMRQGSPSGSADAQLKNPDGELRWYHADYTLIRDERGRPDHTVITVFDNTLYMQREFAYVHWGNMIKSLIAESAMFTEANLTHNRIEREMGDPKYLVNGRTEETLDAYLEYDLKHFIHPEDAETFRELMRRDRLVMLYYDGVYEDEAQVRLLPDGAADSPRWFSVRVSMTGQPSTGDVMLLVTYIDIDEQKRERDRLTVMAHHDSMTGLLNRETLERRVTGIISTGGEDRLVAMFLIDLDNFKSVNDNYGHQAGDELLIATAAAVAGVFRQDDVVGRIGGDEFMAFMAGGTPEIIENRARELVRSVRLNVQERPVTASVGVYITRAKSAEYDAMYRMSDEAMYMAKDAGKGGYYISCAEDVRR